MHKIKTLFHLFNITAFCISIGLAFLNKQPYFLLLLLPVIPITLIGLHDIFQKNHTILRNFPVVGHVRYLLLKIRPEIHQYFVESNSDGAPLTFEKRSVIYQRAKKVLDTMPFGTRLDVNRVGYEWTNHSLSPKKVAQDSLRVKIGGDQCMRPYNASLLNISAMSFGALSRNAIMALNGGAKTGGFAHNTGEGGLSPYHLKNEGDIIWQIGTAYFGCRDKNGKFNPELFKEKSNTPQVKMIEIKLSQGAKPGKGGILPGAKVTQEIAKIRNVQVGETVFSPASHSSFSNPIELMEFIAKLRELSGGKPVGFKVCFGKRREIYSICKAMVQTGIAPDYIAIDGAEGGTGSAPLEFSNSVGTPITEGLIDLENALIGFGIRDKIKIIASGKITTGFDIVRFLSLGADLCYAARAFMISLGCIQALQCNTDTCPTGVATQDPTLYKGIHVNSKKVRVSNFQEETLHSVAELLGAMGLSTHQRLKRWHIMKRISLNEVRNYGDLFPYLEKSAFLGSKIPQKYARVLKGSSANTFDSVLH